MCRVHDSCVWYDDRLESKLGPSPASSSGSLLFASRGWRNCTVRWRIPHLSGLWSQRSPRLKLILCKHPLSLELAERTMPSRDKNTKVKPEPRKCKLCLPLTRGTSSNFEWGNDQDYLHSLWKGGLSLLCVGVFKRIGRRQRIQSYSVEPQSLVANWNGELARAWTLKSLLRSSGHS